MVPMSEVAEHPKPSVATVKELYAHAFTCARPDCTEWLYRQDIDSPEPVLNSRVAHIHARRAGGPRWKPGMPSDENRSAENLLLLCIPHSYEVDDHPDGFPAELLEGWRLSQRSEHDRLRKAWPLNDTEAESVLRESFDTSALNHAVISDTARRVEQLALGAEASRRHVAVAAQAWRSLWDQLRVRPFGWDEDGNPVYVEPSYAEDDQHRQALLRALEQAHGEVEPLVNAVKAETAVARSTTPRVEKWSHWVDQSSGLVLRAVSRWPGARPGEPPAPDDDALLQAVAELRRASGALASALRSETPEEPPPPPTVDTVEGDKVDDPLVRHCALLDRARPYARVKHLEYNADLRDALSEAAVDAATLPPVPNALAFGLRATAGLAADVARNATEDELISVINTDRVRKPIGVAIALLWQLASVLDEQGHGSLAEAARDATLDTLRATDWTAAETWDGNEHCGRLMFDIWASISTPEEPLSALTTALEQCPERLSELLLCCAEWAQHESQRTGQTRYSRHLRSVRAWFPISAILIACAAMFPDVKPAQDRHDEKYVENEIEYLVSHVLRLATEESNE